MKTQFCFIIGVIENGNKRDILCSVILQYILEFSRKNNEDVLKKAISLKMSSVKQDVLKHKELNKIKSECNFINTCQIGTGKKNPHLQEVLKYTMRQFQ